MIISLFDSIYRAYVREQIELDWTDLVSVLSYHNTADSKEGVMLYNLAKFRSADDPLCERGRKNRYRNGEWTGEWNEIPNTVRRSKHNLLEVWGIVLDVDDTKTISETQNDLDGLEYLLYTTFNHTPERHKYRVVIPFTRPLDPEALRLRQQDIMQVFPGVDRASFSQSQSFYFHSGRCSFVHHNQGEMIDPYRFKEQQIVVRATDWTSQSEDSWFVDQLLQRIYNQYPNMDGQYNTWRVIAWATCHAVGKWEAEQLLMRYWPKKTKKESVTLNKWNSNNSPTVATLIKHSGISSTERKLMELQSRIRRKS